VSSTNIQKIGQPAALIAAGSAITYSVFQLLAVFKLIPHPQDLFWLFLPSLILSYTFLNTIICFHNTVKESYKIYTAIASAFALVYCALVSIVYFTQLVVIFPLLKANRTDESHILAFTDKSFMVAIDCISYAAMNTANLFAAFAFQHDIQQQWLYKSLLANGLLTPVVILAFFISAFMFIRALWMITLHMAMIYAEKLFSSKTHKPTLSYYETAAL